MRALRERLLELKRQGFIVTDIRHGKHTKIRAVAPSRRTLLLVVSRSPSDWRLQRKFSAQLKQFARSAPAAMAGEAGP